jgi:glucosamine--fructose-6-phosphate aminotransferase (isomerizing)
LLVAISFSGEGARTVESVRAAREEGATVVAVTANEHSTLAQASDRVLRIQWRSASRAIPHSADYATTLLAVAACIESLSHRCLPVLDRLADLVAESLETLRPACEQLGEALATRDRLFFLGSGPSMATAQYGAAKFWEAAGLTGASPSSWRSSVTGRTCSSTRTTRCSKITPTGRTEDRTGVIAEGLRELGAVPVVVGDQSPPSVDTAVLGTASVAEEWSPFTTCLPLQLVCRKVATAKGHDVAEDTVRSVAPDLYGAVQRRWIR